MSTFTKGFHSTTSIPSYSIQLEVLSKDVEIHSLYNRKIIKLAAEKNDHPDSGFDLFVPERVEIPAKSIKPVYTGVKCAVYKNLGQHEGKATMSAFQSKPELIQQPSPYYLYPRSSVSKRGIILANSVGIIDSGYRGQLVAYFYNTTMETVVIEKGERVTQICLPDLSYNFEIKLVNSLTKTERGEGGLGSTGK